MHMIYAYSSTTTASQNPITISPKWILEKYIPDLTCTSTAAQRVNQNCILSEAQISPNAHLQLVRLKLFLTGQPG